MYGNPYYEHYIDTANSLEHYGVKGMKWGVRRTPEQLGKRTSQAKERLDKARKGYSEAYKSGDKNKLFKARKELSAAGKNFRTARSVDRGERLRSSGKTSFGIAMRSISSKTLVDIGVNYVTRYISANYADKNWSKTAISTINIGRTFTKQVIATNAVVKMRDIQKYDANRYKTTWR